MPVYSLGRTDNTVVVLGAGASRAAGGPLMADFLDVAERLSKAPGNPDVESFSMVFEAIAELQAVHSKAELDLLNVESVFAAFEMAALFAQPLGRLPAEDVARLPNALRSVIARTLDMSIRFKFASKSGWAPPPGYGDMVGQIAKRYQRTGSFPTILTFNYDVALDFALYIAGFRVDYGLDDDGEGNFNLFKLHGSLNWALCPGCGEVVPLSMQEYFNRYSMFYATHPTDVQLDLPSRLEALQHCGNALPPTPVIVPPTWNKSAHYSQVRRVWQRAAKRLADAEHIFVLGYSLPVADHFFRHLYALGTIGPTRIKRFWVIDPDESGVVRSRFLELLGPTVRTRFDFVPRKFETAAQTFDEWLSE